MKKQVILDDADWGQIMDGLSCRAEQYEITARYYEADISDGVILDVRDEEEARSLASWYWGILKEIRRQVKQDVCDAS